MMLRYLIFSDSHNMREPMLTLYNRYPCDGVIHLGDHCSDAEWLLQRTLGQPVYRVRGNCDYSGNAPLDQLLELGGLKVFITHGHLNNVKNGHALAISAARARGADVLLFGHTHTQLMERREGLLVLNPGAIRNGCYGILEIEDGRAKGALLTL